MCGAVGDDCCNWRTVEGQIVGNCGQLAWSQLPPYVEQPDGRHMSEQFLADSLDQLSLVMGAFIYHTYKCL